MEEPTGRQVHEVASAMVDAGRAKCEELGIEFDLLAVAMAADSIMGAMKMMCRLHEVLGFDGLMRFADALENSEKYKVIKEAEEAINGD